MDKTIFENLNSEEDYKKVISNLIEFADNSSDEEFESFIDSLYNRDVDIRELSVEFNEDTCDYDIYFHDSLVGYIDDHMFEMVFNSYEVPFGRDYPLIVSAPKRSYGQSPEDEVSIAMFECFDRYVRSGEPFRTRYGLFWEPYTGFIPYLRYCLRLLDSRDEDELWV